MVKPGIKLQTVLILLVTWGLLLAFFVAYQIYFVRGQEEFLRENGFRSLAALSSEVTAKVTKARKSTESFLQLVQKGTEYKPESNEYKDWSATLRAYLTLYLGDPSISKQSLDALTKCAVPPPESKDSPPLQYTMIGGRLRLSISCFQANHTLEPENRIRLYTVDVSSWVDSAFQEQVNDFDDVLIINSTGQVIFEKSMSGTVITDLNSLKPTEEKGGPKDKSEKKQTKDSKKPEEEDSGSSEEAKPSTQKSEWLAQQSGASSVAEVTYAGKSYKLFSQPLRIWLPTAPNKGEVVNLVVCGLWDTKRFVEASRKIPYSTLIWATLTVVVLLSLSWPLFKLRYMGRTERFTATDACYLILAVFLASTSVMLMLLNASYMAHAQNEADRNMAKLARQIKLHFIQEVDLASDQLRKFQNYSIGSAKESLIYDYPNHNHLVTATAGPYSYFDSVSWINAKGRQVAKWDMKSAPTPLVPVGSRPYFKSVVSDAYSLGRPGSDLSGKQSAHPAHLTQSDANYLEPILSINTDEFSTILSGPFLLKNTRPEDQNIAVTALSFRPLSLVDPALPPGYRFAVIDRNCNVLFHSDTFRNKRENFCAESKDRDDLRPWLFGEVDTPLDISYEGNPVRAYLTSVGAPRFAGNQPFLLVFREPDRDLTLNLAVVLVCSALLTIYFTVLVVIAIIFLALRRPLHLIYAPKLVWPQRASAVSYAQLFIANVVLLVLFWLFYPKLYELPLLVLSAGVAATSVLFTIFKLTSSRRGPLVLSMLLVCCTLAAWWIPAHSTDPLRSNWWLVLVASGVGSLIAVLLAEAVSSPMTAVFARAISFCVTRVKSWIAGIAPRPISSRTTRVAESLSTPGEVTKSAQTHFIFAYVLMVLSMITAAGLIPCIGSFKYAYDVVGELSLKHDLIVLSNSVYARRMRIRQYYEEVVKGQPVVADDRFANRFDRYYDIVSDGPSRTASDPYLTGSKFEVEDDSRLAAPISGSSTADGNSESCNGTEPAGSCGSGGENAVFKRWMAQATLDLPTNSLGAEMGKLAVTSSDNPNWTWTHDTKRSLPTRFVLNWKSASQFPGMTVTSEYRHWERLRWRDRIWVLVLWVVLSFWLMIVVKKIFFTAIEDTPLDTIDWKKVEDIKKNYMVIERAKAGRAQWLNAIANLSPQIRLDMRVELNKILEDKSYQPSCQDQVAILDYFDFNMKDRRYNEARLKLLEKLLFDSSRKVVLVSTVDPLFFLSNGGPEVLCKSKDPSLAQRLLDHWAVVLSQFTKVRSKDSSDREFHKALKSFDKAHAKAGNAHKNCHEFASWVTEECDCTTHLRTLGKELLERFQEGCCTTREWVVGRVLDLADSYYRVLWAGLTLSERLVLYQLALDGWTNPKNIKAIQQLERKLLISRRPMYRIMNESFRRFAEGTEHAEEIAEWEKQEQQSTWRAFRFVALAVAVGGGAWLFYTQAAYSQAVVGYIAAIGTLLATFGSLFGRSGPPSAKSE